MCPFIFLETGNPKTPDPMPIYPRVSSVNPLHFSRAEGGHPHLHLHLYACTHTCTSEGRRGQRGHLLLEQLLGAGPHGVAAPVVQLEQVRQQVVAEGLGGLARQQRRQVVDADDRQGGAVDLDGDGRLVEGGGDGVDGHGVEGVGGVGRDVADDGQLAAGAGGLERLHVHEVGDLGGQVDAVDEDVALGDLGEGPALGRLGDVPLEDVLLGHACAEAHVDGSATAAA